ncbi:hemerythrin domain-containing protein [Niveibacterium sp. SC-1]|uniref:hemerythrin domain-containing protein n=1 Tax=Niveibacterium sp. SC-1 TaxID=3135646 RepID=UPI0031205338
MVSIIESFLDEHLRCNQIFATAESLLRRGSPIAASHFLAFRDTLEAHCAHEEQVVFPAFETLIGSPDGPTAVLRDEHARMLSLCSEILRAIEHAQADKACGLADSLFLLLQSHMIREERLLYPLCDDALGHATYERPHALPALGTGLA